MRDFLFVYFFNCAIPIFGMAAASHSPEDDFDMEAMSISLRNTASQTENASDRLQTERECTTFLDSACLSSIMNN